MLPSASRPTWTPRRRSPAWWGPLSILVHWLVEVRISLSWTTRPSTPQSRWRTHICLRSKWVGKVLKHFFIYSWGKKICSWLEFIAGWKWVKAAGAMIIWCHNFNQPARWPSSSLRDPADVSHVEGGGCVQTRDEDLCSDEDSILWVWMDPRKKLRGYKCLMKKWNYHFKKI